MTDMKIHDEIRTESLRFVKRNKTIKIDRGDKHSMSYISPRISSEFMDCSMPMTFDSYSHCHPAGTLVIMADGTQKKIEEINEGETVISYDMRNKEIEQSIVCKLLTREVEELIEIETESGITLQLTTDHPVYIKDKGWIKAGELEGNEEIIELPERTRR